MWETKANDQSGGFFHSPSQFGSPAAEKQAKPARRMQNVVPLTIGQILKSSEEGLKIGDMDINMFTVVALVRRIEVSSTKVTYLLDDCTGGITGIFWLDSTDSDEQQRSLPAIVENTYCRLYGSMRMNQGKKHIFIFRIMNLTSLNDLTRHVLEVMFCDLKMQKLAQLEDKEKESSMNTNSGMSNSLIGTGMMTSGSMSGAYQSGLNAEQTLVYNEINKYMSDIGASKDEVIRGLDGKLSVRGVMNIIEFLANEGHIYTTIDDDHFRITDN